MALVLSLAFINGIASVISKMVCFRCTKVLGTNNGSLVNYVVASVLSFILLLFYSRFDVDISMFAKAPWWMYLGGAFGIVAFILSMITLSRLKVFESTILLLSGQLVAGIAFDTFVFHNINGMKLLGILLVTVGIIADKKVSLAGADASPEDM